MSSNDFSIPDQLDFSEGPGGLAVANVNNPLGTAMISLSGAHVMTWQPADHAHPVLWLSEYAKFAPGKSIRGGVPICWPWFGSHHSEAGFPGHGFARTVLWAVTGSESLDDGSTRVLLRLQENDNTRAQWPYDSSVEYAITVGEELCLELITRNLGDTPFILGEALHTYFAVSDIRRTPIYGLEGGTYLDKINGSARKQQDGAILISSEVDRVYVDTSVDCVIEDLAWQRRIHIRKENSHSTIVWNPWLEKAEKMGDFGENGYLGMVCVESGNALENCVELAPGESHIMRVRYCVEAL
jgi:D-hexose-6-phosphate mutarotase